MSVIPREARLELRTPAGVSGITARVIAVDMSRIRGRERVLITAEPSPLPSNDQSVRRVVFVLDDPIAVALPANQQYSLVLRRLAEGRSVAVRVAYPSRCAQCGADSCKCVLGLVAPQVGGKSRFQRIG